MMESQITLFTVLLAALLFAASSHAVIDVESSLISAEGRQASPVTIFTTTTIHDYTTTITTKTRKVCGVFGKSYNVIYKIGTDTLTSTITNSPTRVCRKKRGFFDDAFVGISKDDLGVQFYRLSPSPVVRFEPSRLPYFPNSYLSSNFADVVYVSPDVLQSSLASRQRPIFGGLFPFGNFIYSLLVSNAVSARSTVTSTVSVFSKTSTVTSFTSVITFYLAGNCYPSGVTLC